MDFDMDTSIEEVVRRRILPILRFFAKVYFGQMPKYTCHGDIASAPWRTKIEIELIVLSILSTWDIPLK